MTDTPELDDAKKLTQQQINGLLEHLREQNAGGQLRAIIAIPLTYEGGFATFAPGSISVLEAAGILGRSWQDMNNLLSVAPKPQPAHPPPPQHADQLSPQESMDDWRQRLVPDGQGGVRRATSRWDTGAGTPA